MSLYKKFLQDGLISKGRQFPADAAAFRKMVGSGDTFNPEELKKAINRLDPEARAELQAAAAKAAPQGPEEIARAVEEALYGGAEAAEDAPSVNITAAAQKLAADNGIDYESLTGTGKGGKITTSDVRKAMQAGEEPAGRPSGLRNKAEPEDEVMESGLPPSDPNDSLDMTPDQMREVLKTQYGFTDDLLPDDQTVIDSYQSIKDTEAKAQSRPRGRKNAPQATPQATPQAAPQAAPQATRPQFDPETEAYLNSMEPQGPAMFGMRQGEADVPIEEDLDALAGEVGRPDLMRGDPVTPAEQQGGLFASAGPEKLQEALDQAIAADDAEAAGMPAGQFRTDDPEMMRMFEELQAATQPQPQKQPIDFTALFGPGYDPRPQFGPTRADYVPPEFGPTRADYVPPEFGPTRADMFNEAGGVPGEYGPTAADKFNPAGGIGTEPYGPPRPPVEDPPEFTPDPKRPVGSRAEEFLRKRGLEGVSLGPITRPIDFVYRNPVGTAIGAGALYGGARLLGFGGGSGNEPMSPEEEADLQQRYEAARSKVEEMYGGSGPRQKLRMPADGTNQSF